MAGLEDNVAAVGDWTTPNPSPRTFFSNFLGEDFSSKSFSDLMSQNGNEPPIAKQKVDIESDGKDHGALLSGSDDPFSDPKGFSLQKPGSRGGLAERMAARAGFNAPKLNTARLRSANMTSSPEVRSPYLTIPPGLSPTTLLDSPVFLSNSMAQPSPTTGTFPVGQSRPLIYISVSDVSSKNRDHQLEDIDAEPFVFKPHVESNSSCYACEPNKVVSSTDQPQSLPTIGVPVQPEDAIKAVNQDCTTNHQENHFKPGFFETSYGRDTSGNFTLNQRVSDSLVGSEQSPPLEDQLDGEGELKGDSSSVAIGTPSEDGYNWRKYGQKQVKGSEYPRSYYKCTHPNCQVKKKVERSHEGHVTEIIYKGGHNHPKPPPNRRSGIPLSHPFNNMLGDGSENNGPQATLDGKQIWANHQNGNSGPDWKNDGMEATSSAAELFDPSTSMHTQEGPHFESADAMDVSSTLSNDDDDEDGATHDSVSPDCDVEGDESESKRRKLETTAMDMSAASRALREPRVVVQTTSEVDILDDGYRWRKYGQKVVKGNPNPRSYYKCTNAGCSVRKHVERASHDLKSVITTYEGKHNHDVPAARNSSHGNSGGPSSTASNLASHSHSIHKRMEPSHIQDSLPRFDGPMSLGTFGLSGRELGPQPGFSFGMGQTGLANLNMAALGHAAPKILPPVHTYLRHRQVNENGFMIPKGEPKEEPMSEPGLLMSNAASVYHQQMMSRLPHM